MISGATFDGTAIGVLAGLALLISAIYQGRCLSSSINASKALLVNYKELYAKTAQALNALHPIDPHKNVGDLSISNQQVVEIAKALTLDCRILILDEPTAVLTESETEALFQIMKKLREQGISIIYISHRLSEVEEIADRVMVLRDGEKILSEKKLPLSINKKGQFTGNFSFTFIPIACDK